MEIKPPFEVPPSSGGMPDTPQEAAPGAGELPQVPVGELAAGADVPDAVGLDRLDITAPPDRSAEPTRPRVLAAESDSPDRRRYVHVPLDGVVQPPEAPDPREVVEAMDQAGLAEYFSTPEAAKETLQSMDTDEYHEAAAWANGTIRGLPPEQQGYADERYLTEARNERTGKTVTLSPPGPDRKVLMGEAFEAAQQVDDLERGGTLLNVVTTDVHPWEDANGRMARGQQELLHRGYDGSADDKDYYARLLAGHEGRTLVNTADVALLKPRFNNAVLKGLVEAAGQDQYLPNGGIVPIDRAELGIAGLPIGDIRRDLADMAEEPSFGRTLVTAVALQTGRDLHDYVFRHPDTLKQYFDAGRLIGDISPDEAGIVWDAYGMLKRQYVRSVIDCLGPRGDTRLYGNPDNIVAQYRSQEYRGRWR